MKKEIILFVGKQGAGKGTQAEVVSKEIGFKHISTGELLRNLKGGLKKELNLYIEKGILIPDELMLEILKKEMKKEDKIILDGFPRNLRQAKLLDNLFKITKVIEIYISDEEAIKRLEGRRYCEICGRNYNLITFPKPKEDELCDICKVKLKKRKDDNKEAIKKRLETYKEKTLPILDYYRERGVEVIRIDGSGKIEDVKKRILKIFKS